MSELPCALFDADNHYYEPRDCFTRFIEPKYRDKAIYVIEREHDDVVMAGPKECTFLTNPNFRSVVRPGTLRDILRNIAKGIDENTGLWEPLKKEYVERSARIETMDAQRLESCVMHPSLGVCVEHFMKDDVLQTYANVHAFNRWIDEDWGFNYKSRIYSPPVLSLLDPQKALEEAEWVLKRGARLVGILPGPTGNGRNPCDPVYDAFWSRLNEAKVGVVCHIGESGYNALFSTAWGEAPNPSAYKQSAFQWTCFYGDRPIMETVSALVFGNLFGRFPNLSVLSVENGSLWVPYLMKAMDKMYGMGKNGPWIGGMIKEKPSQIFRKHVYVSPYHEEDIAALANLIGADRVLFGSDYPHSEGLAEPKEFQDGLKGLNAEQVKLIMGDNARRIVAAA